VTRALHGATVANGDQRRVCPLLERPTPTCRLAYAPAPWVLVKCLESGFVFLENPPGYAALEEDYAWEITSPSESRARREAEPVLYRASIVIKRFRHRVLRRNKTAAIVRDVIMRLESGPINVVDLGCGRGLLLRDIIGSLPQRWRDACVPHGVEISRGLAAIANQALSACGGACLQASALEGLNHFEEHSLDVIVMCSFLEHEIHPLPLLRECVRRLRPGGVVVVKVPNFASANRWLRKVRWCGFRWPDHVNYFTPRTLRAMAAAAGLRVARMSLLDRQIFSDNMYAVFRHAQELP